MTHPQARAVVIDDDLLLCKYFEVQLRRAGMHLCCAHTGQDGLLAVREQLPDIVLLDVGMPDIDGFEVCRQLKADDATAHIPIMFITGSSDAYIRAFQVGATDCVTKPIRGTELQARVQRALRQETTFVPQSAGDDCACDDREATTAAEDEQRRLNMAMSEVDQILGVVGHELRTPLAGLRVMAEFLLTDKTSGTKPHEFLQAIHDEIVRLSNMVNNLLESARINSGSARWSWGEVAVKEVCESAMSLIAPLGASDIRFVCDVQPELMSMFGDSDAIRRLLLNLLSNAQKHTSSGVISIHARYTRDTEGIWVELSVADTGRGIAPEITEKLGVPFALNGGVTDNAVGSGLGISICKSIAAVHGGTLRIDSTAGKGTVVTARVRANLPQPALSNPNQAISEAAA